MSLVISESFVREVLSRAKKDGRLARAMAEEWMGQVEPIAMARYLLSGDAAVKLLAQRLQETPEKTLRELQALPTSNGRASSRPTAGRQKQGAKKVKPVSLLSGPSGVRTRRRLSAQQVARIKNAIKTFLAANPQSSRRRIVEAVSIPTDGVYNRVMGELRESGDIVVAGQKATAVYSLGGGRGKRKKAAKKA